MCSYSFSDSEAAALELNINDLSDLDHKAILPNSSHSGPSLQFLPFSSQRLILGRTEESLLEEEEEEEEKGEEEEEGEEEDQLIPEEPIPCGMHGDLCN